MSADRETVHAADAPAAIGPYSHAVRCGGLLFCSGQIPLDPASGELVGVSAVGAGAPLPRESRGRLRAPAGTTLERAVRITIYMVELSALRRGQRGLRGVLRHRSAGARDGRRRRAAARRRRRDRRDRRALSGDRDGRAERTRRAQLTSNGRSPRWCAGSSTSRSCRRRGTSTMRTSFPDAIVEQMRELGLFGVTIPERYGGMGLDLDDLRDDRRGALARLDLDLGHRQHALPRLLSAGQVRHRRAARALPAARWRRGELRAAFSLSEPELGSDVAAIKSLRRGARRRGLGDQRPEDVGDQRAALVARVRARPHRSARRSHATAA